MKQLIVIFFLFNSILDRYKSQKMCDRAVSDYPFLIVYCPNGYMTKTLYNDTVDDSLSALKLIPNCCVTSNMI